MRFDKIEFTAAYGTSSQLPPPKEKEIVFSGRSNVGKSSLINKVFNRKNLARVSSVPGKTITVNFFKGDSVYFVDLPGYGYAKREQKEKKRWAELMDGYFNSGRDIALVVQLIDMRHAPSQDDMTMLNFLKEMNIPFVIVLTKSDKLNKTERKSRLKAFEEELAEYEGLQWVPFSAVTREGVDDLRDILISVTEEEDA